MKLSESEKKIINSIYGQKCGYDSVIRIPNDWKDNGLKDLIDKSAEKNERFIKLICKYFLEEESMGKKSIQAPQDLNVSIKTVDYDEVTKLLRVNFVDGFSDSTTADKKDIVTSIYTIVAKRVLSKYQFKWVAKTFDDEVFLCEPEKPETFKDRLKKERPNKVGSIYYGGCLGCPSTYGYEDHCNGCFRNGKRLHITKDTCAECWNREIPKEKEEN